MTVSSRRIYLDHNASAPLLPEARAALIDALEVTGNPSSVHREGRSARALMAQARSKIARLVGADAEEVVFTSGATEAAVTCLTPDWVLDGQHVRLPRLAVLDTDHPCLREGGRFDPEAVTRLPVDRHGIVDMRALTAWLAMGEPGILAFTAANSETGVLQPLSEIVSAAHAAGCVVVVDAVQMATRIPLDTRAIGADALILSGHKIGAPKGIGAFVLGSTERRPAPLLTGGAQETRQRAGTEALALIAAFGAAAEAGERSLDRGGHDALTALRDHCETALALVSREVQIVGDDADRLPQTVSVHHPRLTAETVQIALDLDGIAVSAGSACSSGKVGPSHVLEALHRAGAPIDPQAGAIRVSFGLTTTRAEIDAFLKAYARLASRVDADNPRENAA
ncbi:cysteine desulfurase family protein [Aureimonas sp. AU12]|uniref:cysteine desulfurase family protein n=1 Tax=Aureimonas sp. AU12 TaxID=1638161 RepID=UPI000782FB32|nr:aminotransferase class V-fold PLP-dependent enzyme [Aureimonas sp. AU12]